MAGKFLKSLGHKVIFGISVLKPGALDYKHLEKSTNLNGILVSFDRDFVINKDLREKIKLSSGVIQVQASDSRPETAIRILNKILKKLRHKSIKGKICTASVHKIVFK